MTDEMDLPFPPGPRDPIRDRNVPGPRVTITRYQIEKLTAFAEGADAKTVRVEDRGGGAIRAVAFDEDGNAVARMGLIFPGLSTGVRRIVDGRAVEEPRGDDPEQV
jgi:hypothetical protein